MLWVSNGVRQTEESLLPKVSSANWSLKMTGEKSKQDYIELFRKYKFNCFPIPKNQKVADKRYKASQTTPNQTIHEGENYGVLPTIGSGNAIIDFDSKEQFREFAEKRIKDGYMVIESPHGWHLPVVGLSGKISKTELFDYKIQTKKIIEIQGKDHYCVGVESSILDKETEKVIKYINRGSNKILDVKGMDFHKFVDDLCKICSVESRKRGRSSYKYLRERFLAGEIPLKGSSNDYFFQSAIQCNTDGLSIEEATAKIKTIYHKWSVSDTFSDRPWSNIEAKIQEVYDKNITADRGRPKQEHDENNLIKLCEDMIAERKIYSDEKTDEIFEDKKGFLENITKKLHKELQIIYPELEERHLSEIKFRLVGLAPDLPIANKDIIVFRNSKWNTAEHKITETDDLADMGFKGYDYLPPAKENEPTEFIKVMFENVDESEHSRIKAGLRSIISNYLDSRISVIHGLSGVGKSTGLLVLVKIMKKFEDYSLTVELGQLLKDPFIKAHTRNKRLLVIQDMPDNFKDFEKIKTLTGEGLKTERGFHQDMVEFENKLKIWGSGNYLAEIPEKEKNPMYSRRLSLIHNTREIPYEEDPKFADDIVEKEGEKIVSWILNLKDDECQYEDRVTLQTEWENLSSPEIGYLQNNWEIKTDITDSAISVMNVKMNFEEKYQIKIPLKTFRETMEEQGYVIIKNIVKNIVEKTPKWSKPASTPKGLVSEDTR